MTVRVVLILSVGWIQPAFAVETYDASASQVSLAEAWKDAATGRGTEAREVFEQHEGREARLGKALALLGAPTKSVKNLTRAGELLTGILEGGDDELGLAACYALARIEHVHRRSPDLAAAMVHYRRLRTINPVHPLAEQALVKMGIIELYAPGLSIDERRAVWTNYAGAVEGLLTSEARRDLNLLLAHAGQRYRFDQGAILDFFCAAEKAGILRSALRADVYVNIVNLSRALRRTDLCREYCERFMAAYRRDNRYHMVSEIHREVSADAVPGVVSEAVAAEAVP